MTSNAMTRRSVAVIGAGASGLVVAKVLLQDGFNVTVFDRQGHLGGIWSEELAYADLHSQSVAGFLEFSDLPNSEAMDFAPWRNVCAYLQTYANRFGISDRIRLGSRVVSVHKDDLKNANVPWTIKVETPESQYETFQFDFLVVATGLFSVPHLPILRGQEKFSGRIVHGCAVKTREEVKDKRVVIIGGGKCATDMAVLAGSVARTCYLVFRRAHWMIPPKLMGGRLPFRFTFTRLFTVPFDPFPGAPHSALFYFIHRHFRWVFTKIFEMVSADAIATLGPDFYGDKIFLPSGSYRNGENLFMVSKDFVQLKKNGRIVGKLAAVDQIVDETTIRLDSGEQLQADMIICATGFIEHFPFFSSTLVRSLGLTQTSATSSNENDLNLYRRIVPVGIANMAFVGFTAAPNQWTLTEVASHWISDYFLGRFKLPDSEKEIYEEIESVRTFIRKQFNKTSYYTNYYWLEPMEIYLNDMGLPLHRTNNWISEYFAIYRPERLKNLHQERQAKAEGRTTAIAGRHWYLGFGQTVLILVVFLLLIFFF